MTEIAHYSALLPLLGLLAFKRNAPLAYWLVAYGFAVSFFADTATVVLGGSWAITHVYPAVQLGLFGWAFGSKRLVGLLLALALVQAIMTPLAGPDMLVTTIGSLAVLYLSIGHALAPTMVLYCFVATALYLVLVTEMFRPHYMSLWYSYQGVRLASFALFGRAVWRTSEA